MIEKVQGQIHYLKHQCTLCSVEAVLTFQKLILTIKDYRDWFIYSQQFQNNSAFDRVSLSDIYYALFVNLNKGGHVKRNDDNMVIQSHQFKRQQFHMIPEQSSQAVNGFIAQKQGKIVVVITLYSFELKKDIRIQNEICLEKRRKLTPKQKQNILKMIDKVS